MLRWLLVLCVVGCAGQRPQGPVHIRCYSGGVLVYEHEFAERVEFHVDGLVRVHPFGEPVVWTNADCVGEYR